MLPPVNMTPPLLGTPVRVNPFSLRRDLNGGRCKLLDTPSKSVISLTFTMPALGPRGSALPLRGVPPVPPRRCRSLPCTPELSRPSGVGEEEDRRHTGEVDRREEGGAAEGSGAPVELEMVSLERLDEEDEQEPMDCSRSPEAADGERLTSSSTWTNGWRLPVCGGPPSLSPLLRPDNNNGSAPVIGQQLQWRGGRRTNGHSRSWVISSSDPPAPPEQDDVISCPGCCLLGLSFPSVCLRGTAAVPAPPRRSSTRHRPQQTLHGTISGGSSSPGVTKAPACCSRNGVTAGATSAAREPGRSLPEAQT